ncbi:hypothetical protein LINGRAHAP2_LOCUS34882 [Linum grandiflorum]
MYRELGKASRANSKKFSGCMTLLQSWIYEYLPSLRGADSPASRAVGAPLAGSGTSCAHTRTSCQPALGTQFVLHLCQSL